MIEYRNINPNESGLSIRAKLNKMFSDLISGIKSVNNLWKAVTSVNDALKNTTNDITELRKDFQERILDTLGYTDREINDLYSYVNGMYGGVNGFAESTDFTPNYPIDTAATVIGVGPGTFTNFLDENGNAITIDSEIVVIFFKAEGVTFWKYKTVTPTIIRNEVVNELGNSESKVISQKFFTDKIKHIVGDAIDITDVATLDTYGDPSKNGVYSLLRGTDPVGTLLISGDSLLVQQYIFGSFEVENGSITFGETPGVLIRTKNIGSITSDIGRGSWGDWRMVQDDFMQVLSEETYENLKASGLLKENTFYFLYTTE